MIIYVIVALVCLAVGAGAATGITMLVQKNKLGKANAKASKLLEDAENEAKTIKKEALLEAKEEAYKLKAQSDKEIQERRIEIQRQENRLIQKEESLDRKEEVIDRKSQALDDAKQTLENKTKQLTDKELQLENEKLKIGKELERVAGLSKEEAKKQLVDSIVDDARKEAGNIVRDIENTAREEGEKKARDIVTLAIQKCATDQTSEVTVTAVALPNDEMKGRIIGREGRNIRAIENATGVDLIVDDTPEAVILSSFDPIRREVARLTLEKLITDGRIHPARVEDIVEKVKKDMDKKKAKEEAIKLLGRVGIPEPEKRYNEYPYQYSGGMRQRVLRILYTHK